MRSSDLGQHLETALAFRRACRGSTPAGGRQWRLLRLPVRGTARGVRVAQLASTHGRIQPPAVRAAPRIRRWGPGIAATHGVAAIHGVAATPGSAAAHELAATGPRRFKRYLCSIWFIMAHGGWHMVHGAQRTAHNTQRPAPGQRRTAHGTWRTAPSAWRTAPG